MKSRKELTRTLREACAEVDTWQPWQRSRDPEGDAVSNQPKPAPTAEEQLPPYDEKYVEMTEDLGTEDGDSDVMVRLALDCRERQLLAALAERDAALRSNREDKLHITALEAIAKTVNAELEGILGPANGKSIIQVVKEFQAQLAEGGGWIAEPTEQGWWWHADDPDAKPFMYGIMQSGTNGKMFIQYPDSRWCSDVGGLWAKATPPPLPTPPSVQEEKGSSV